MRLRIFVLLALPAVAATAFADENAPLPTKMNGHWTAVVPGRQTYMDSLSVVLVPPSNGTGPVTGQLTLHGVTCGAIDEPLTGSWNGTELRLVSKVHPNVNSQRPNGQCGNGALTFDLKRRPGQSVFEGESTRDGSPITSQVTLSP